MNRESEFQPNWISTPGTTILEILQEKKISPRRFASEMERPIAFIDELVSGEVEITPDIAKKLTSIVGASSEFWERRESSYRKGAARLRKTEEEAWVKALPLSDMIRFGWIERVPNMLEECLRYFEVASIKDWEATYSKTMEQTAFRTSKAYTTQKGAVASWLRQGELLSSTIECEKWNEKLFEDTLVCIRPLTRKKNPKDFLPELIEACAKCGVAVAIVPTPSGCRASGATKFVSRDKAMLLLSFRYLSDDHFWFTFFHEAGHILLHGDKGLFLEEIGSRRENQEENDANFFAGEMLIPQELQSKLKDTRGKRNIIKFAMLAGISPGIVVGQQQFHGFISHGYLNGYKRRYNWEDIMKL